MVLDKYNKIVCFVEVKKKGQKLKPMQDVFSKFCEERNIPCYKWTPEIDLPLVSI